MQINWVISKDIKDIEQSIDVLKNIGPLWGSYITWKKFKTDNCICHEKNIASDLIKRAFHAVSNLYIPSTLYTPLGRPVGVKLFDGGFDLIDVINKDDIISLHLAASNANIILLLGFDLTTNIETSEVNKFNRNSYYKNLIILFNSNPDIQFVIVDHYDDTDQMFNDIPNLTFDTTNSIISLLNS